MLPITLEIPADPISLSILRQSWREIGEAFPAERGRAIVEPSPLRGLERITLEVPSREQAYQALLATLTHIDKLARLARAYPTLYQGHVIYQEEPIGSELWQSTPALYARGIGDCEDLACDLAATYQLAGVDAHATLRLEQRTTTGDVWHVIVAFADGRTEDPSRRLGMTG